MEKKNFTLNAMEDDALENVAGGLLFSHAPEYADNTAGLVSCRLCRKLVPENETRTLTYSGGRTAAVVCKTCFEQNRLAK